MNKKYLFLTALILMFTVACNKTEIENKEVNLTDAKIRIYKNKIEQDPGNYRNYDNLCAYYFQKARETGNKDYYKLADQAISKSLEINPDNYIGIVLFAKLRLANHEFEQALLYAKRALKLKPNSSSSYGILGDAYLELHQISNAEKAYKKMVELNPSLDSYGRMSNLMHHKHNHEKAILFMELAYDAGLKKSSTPKENLAWTQVMLGEFYLESGKTTLAKNYFKNALELYEGYYLAERHLKEVSKLM